MWDIDGFNNESDVEQKFLWNLLVSPEGLGFESANIKTKIYFRKYTVGKRKSAKGHVPDYLIDFIGIPVAVIEAKHPRDDLSVALSEAGQYALELNTRFPADIDPVQLLLVTDGFDLVVSPWNSLRDSTSMKVKDISIASEYLRILQKKFNPNNFEEHAKKVRALLTPNDWRNPSVKIVNSNILNRELPPNTFAENLVGPLSRFLAKDAGRDSEEIIKYAYVSTSENTSYEKEVESLLRDTLARHLKPEAQSIVTKPGEIQGGHDTILAPRFDKSTSSLTLLIGGVGSGKSIFMDRFIQELAPQHELDKIVYLIVDFNNAPEDISAYRKWVHQQLVAGLKMYVESSGEKFYDYRVQRKMFSKFIGQLKQTLCGDAPGAMSEEKFEEFCRTKIVEWQQDDEKLIDGAYHHFTGEIGKEFVIFLDNADKGTHAEQIAVFQNCMELLNTVPCTAILAMREETYDLYSNKPPLDTVTKPRVLRIKPPRLVDVLSKRVDLLVKHLQDELPDKLFYYLEGNVQVEYPGNALAKYISQAFADLFHTDKNYRIMLESLAGNNVRRALEMFISVLSSPYLGRYAVGFASEGNTVGLQKWSVVRTLMRGKSAYYSDTKAECYVANVFQTDGRSRSTDNCIILEILAILVREQKRPSEIGVPGYVSVKYLQDSPELMQYSSDDVIWAVKYCYHHNLVTSDINKEEEVESSSYIKVTASGYWHIHSFTGDIEYISNVAMCIWLRGDEVASKIMNSMLDDRYDSLMFGKRRVTIMLDYLTSEISRHEEVAAVEPERLSGSAALNERLTKIREVIAKPPWTMTAS